MKYEKYSKHDSLLDIILKIIIKQKDRPFKKIESIEKYMIKLYYLYCTEEMKKHKK